MKTIQFCGKKNCCPEFVHDAFGIGLKNDAGQRTNLTKEEFMDLVGKIKSMEPSEILDFVGRS